MTWFLQPLVAFTLALFVTAAVPLFISGASASALERITLELSGPSCGSQRAELAATLSSLAWVRTIDFTSVPDHVLVDIDGEAIHHDDAIRLLTQAITSPSCYARAMQGCISAAVHPSRTSFLSAPGTDTRSP